MRREEESYVPSNSYLTAPHMHDPFPGILAVFELVIDLNNRVIDCYIGYV